MERRVVAVAVMRRRAVGRSLDCRVRRACRRVESSAEREMFVFLVDGLSERVRKPLVLLR